MINDASEKDAKEQLQQFLKETLSFLRNLALGEYRAQDKSLFVKELVRQIREAWEEFEEDFNVDRARELIHSAPRSALQSHALYGEQLKLKLSAIQYWKERFFGNISGKFLIRVLDAVDTLLDSLIKATNMDGAIKEIKDALRNLVDAEDL